jgi:small subunit ribosomal protein S20
MAHHKSALKRIRQSRKLRLYNRMNRKSYKLILKEVNAAKTFEEATEKFIKATSIFDRLTAKGILHKNCAANHKSAMALYVNSLKKSVN